MRESVRLGRIAGIRVGVNWSILVVFWLICWSLAAAVLPQQVPEATAAAYWTAGVGTAVAFFASLLAHELGHAVVARRAGLPVEGITLWLLGGVAKLDGEAANPRAELGIAAVGPLISLVLAAVAAAVAAVSAVAGLPRLLVASVAWLGRINLLLAGFNLLPAAPLDGGRLLRGLLWWRTQDRLGSAVAAARMGRLLGAGLVGLGFGELVVGAGIGGLWLALLGWFLLNAARAEETSARLRQTLAGVRVQDVMAADPVVGPSWLTVSAFLEDYALPNRCSAFPLRTLDGTLVGLVTLARLTTVPSRQRPTTRVEAVMCPLAQVPTATPRSCWWTCWRGWGRAAAVAGRWWSRMASCWAWCRQLTSLGRGSSPRSPAPQPRSGSSGPTTPTASSPTDGRSYERPSSPAGRLPRRLVLDVSPLLGLPPPGRSPRRRPPPRTDIGPPSGGDPDLPRSGSRRLEEVGRAIGPLLHRPDGKGS